MKRLIPLMLTILLSITLLPSAVLAADGSLANFATDAQAPAFSDVSPEDWFYQSVETVSRAGLMIGVGENRFAPDADITLAEVYTIAARIARIHALYPTADEYDNPPDKPWFYGYVKYCMDNGIMPGEPGDVTQPASRIECASLLSRALPDSELQAINAVADNAIPDLPLSPDKPNAADVYKLYRAGVLTGTDDAGTFRPESRIRRCEVAAIAARLIDPDLRCVSKGMMTAKDLRRIREQIDAAYDAFLAEHYELENMSSYLAVYASRRIDLNGDGWNELIVYRMPTEAYPLDIYEFHHPTGEVRAFHTTLEGIPASPGADPDGFWCAQAGAHDADKPDGFYGDFFSVNGQTFLISMNGAEFWQKIVCHAFAAGSGSLAAETVFTAERYGEFVADETKKNKAFVNGEEIPADAYSDALTKWRQSWQERMGDSAVILAQTPILGEFELSGWPIE